MHTHWYTLTPIYMYIYSMHIYLYPHTLQLLCFHCLTIVSNTILAYCKCHESCQFGFSSLKALCWSPEASNLEWWLSVLLENFCKYPSNSSSFHLCHTVLERSHIQYLIKELLFIISCHKLFILESNYVLGLKSMILEHVFRTSYNKNF